MTRLPAFAEKARKTPAWQRCGNPERGATNPIWICCPPVKGHNLSQPDAPEKNKKNTPAEVGTLVLRGGAACVCWNILGGQRNRENLIFIYVFAYGHLFIYIYIPIIIYMSCYIYIYIIVNTCTFISTAMSYRYAMIIAKKVIICDHWRNQSNWNLWD